MGRAAWLWVWATATAGCAASIDGSRRDAAPQDTAVTDAVLDVALDASDVAVAPPGDPPRALGVGSNGGCVVTASGALWCWGTPASGRDAGTADLTQAWQVAEVHGAAEVSPFLEEAVVRATDGTVSGWGFSHHGQLGLAIAPNATTGTVLPLPGVSGVVQLSAGHHHVCAVTTAHTVMCWGGPYSPSLGVPGVRQTQTPVFPTVTDVVQVAASAESVCAMQSHGTVWCWGNVLSSDGSSVSDAPHAVAGVTDAIAVTAGWDHSCVLHADGTVGCWGANTTGQLGDGTMTTRNSPVTAVGLDHVVQVSAGDGITCALRADGTVWCTGLAYAAPYGTTPGRFSAVNTLPPAVSVVAGTWQACALGRDGSVWCWGRAGGLTGAPPTRITGLP